MTINPFFKNKGPFKIEKLLKLSGIDNNENFIKSIISDIKDLSTATKDNITFFHSKKYETLASTTKASFCITKDNLSKILPKSCKKIIVSNVLIATAKITKTFYPNAVLDNFDDNLKDIDKTSYKKKIKHGKNVLIGKNVKIGKNSNIGSNSIIESNVNIGENCIIGSFITVRNSLILNNVHIQDGSKIGVKGFGFIPNKNKNIRTPHVGKAVLEEGVEIGANSTIDRGSLADTVIGKNTFIDNQVHVAHNVQIGKNCMIAGQVGFAGSTNVGDNVVIGGQAGISGHLNIGNNVKIGGGSGVINDISDNHQVMGYPAVLLKEFVKQRKK